LEPDHIRIKSACVQQLARGRPYKGGAIVAWCIKDGMNKTRDVLESRITR
jgi:hypothetical protein